MHGQGELLARVDGTRVAVTLLTGRNRDRYLERDRLRVWLTHLALAASGAGANHALTSLVVVADRNGQVSKPNRAEFAPMSAAAASALLEALVGELLGGVTSTCCPARGSSHGGDVRATRTR